LIEDSIVQISILWRLISGYSLIMLLSVGVSSYSIVQLGRLSGTARAALDTDNRLIAYQEKLTDTFLSEVRYAGRFIITHTVSLHDQFRQFKNDFIRYMGEIKSLGASPDVKARLARVEELHLRYQDLFDQEVHYIKAGQPYAESRFQQEKEKILESALRELERLKRHLHNNLNDKLETMDTAARGARTGAGLATLLLLGLGVVLSLAISKSITRPLAALKRITTEEAERDSSSSSEFYRIPEIRELSDALSEARRKLRREAETNSTFVHTITEHFVLPLVSLKKRLAYLQAELTEKVTAEQRTTLEVLAAETERLILHCAQLQPSPIVQVERRSRQEQTALRGVETSLPRTDKIWKRHRHGLLPRRIGVAGRIANLVAGSWNAISHSVRTIASGKAEKR
jgi:CHASE3 domain sensor protein